MTDPARDASAFPAERASAAIRHTLLAVAAIAGLVFLHSPGMGDVGSFWLPYMESATSYGVIEGYSAVVKDYPPLSYVILRGAEWVCLAGGIKTLLGLKVCLLLFYGSSIALFQAFWKEPAPLALFIATVLLSAMLLVYIDILYAPTLLLSLWALQRRRIALFSVLYAASCLIKWQPLIFAPFAFWYALRPAAEVAQGSEHDTPARRFLRLAVPGGLLTLTVMLVFGRSLFDSFFMALSNTGLSGTALNLNWVGTYLLHRWDPGTFGKLIHGEAMSISADALHGWQYLPKAIFAGVYLVTLWRFNRGENSFCCLLRASLLGYLSYCLFNTGVHENHLFVAAILACVLAGVEAQEIPRAIVVTVMAALNLIMFYGFLGEGLGYSRVIVLDATCWLSLLYVAVFLWWWIGWLRVRTPQYPVPGFSTARFSGTHGGPVQTGITGSTPASAGSASRPAHEFPPAS